MPTKIWSQIYLPLCIKGFKQTESTFFDFPRNISNFFKFQRFQLNFVTRHSDKIDTTAWQIMKIRIRKNKRKNCMIHFIFRFSIFAPELSKSVQNFCKTVFFVLILASQNWIPKMICKRILVIFYTYFKIHPRLIFQFTIRDNIMHKTHFWGENYNAGHWW